MHIRRYKGAGIALFQKRNDVYAILLGKRTISPQKGKWSIPGGGFEKDDTSLYKTALREFKEETGIDLTGMVHEKDAVICSFKYPFFEWKTFMFKIDSLFSAPKIFSYEFSEMNFVLLKDLKDYQLAFKVKKEIGKFLKNSAKKR